MPSYPKMSHSTKPLQTFGLTFAKNSTHFIYVDYAADPGLNRQNGTRHRG